MLAGVTDEATRIAAMADQGSVPAAGRNRRYGRVIDALGEAYGGLGDTFRVVWRYAAIAAFLTYLPSYAFTKVSMFAPSLAVHPVFSVAFSVIAHAVEAILEAPVAVAVHRYILLDERPTAGYFTTFKEKRTRHFALIYFLMTSIWIIPVVITAFYCELSLVFDVFVFLFYVVVFVVFLRFSLIFPAIAIDSPSQKLMHSWEDTRGVTTSIFLCSILAVLPITAFFMILSWLAASIVPDFLMEAFAVAGDILISVLTVVIYISFFSCLFKQRANLLSGGG